jgi:two-component system, NarL family, sensor histidine kinase EvgS
LCRNNPFTSDQALPQNNDIDLQIKQMRDSVLSKQCNPICEQEILLVDDQQFNLDVLQSMLDLNFGLKATACSSGEQAVLLFRLKLQQRCCKRVYRLVITDIQMPEMDGFELTHKLVSIQNVMNRKNQRICPIVGATAYTDPANVAKLKKAGAKEVLFKPVDNAMLKRIIQKHFVV